MRVIEPSYPSPSAPAPTSPALWWSSAQRLAASYLAMIAEPPQNWRMNQLGALIADLELARTMVEQVACPPAAKNARFYLMAALTDLQTGLTRLASGDKNLGRAYLRAAQVECEFLDTELNTLGL